MLLNVGLLGSIKWLILRLKGGGLARGICVHLSYAKKRGILMSVYPVFEVVMLIGATFLALLILGTGDKDR